MSTLRQNRPNKAGLKCPSVRTYVPTCVRTSVHKVSSILTKFGVSVEVDEWCTTVCSMTRSKVNVKVTSPWNLEIGHFQKLSPPPFTTGAGNRPRILTLRHNIYIWSGRIIEIWPIFYVMWLWSWQKRQFWRIDRQSRTGLIYLKFVVVVVIIIDHRLKWLLLYRLY